MESRISVIGLGYVGLPLAVAFAKKYRVVGFDINTTRIYDINKGIDTTNEVEREELENTLRGDNPKYGLSVTTNTRDIEDCNFHIITVPTPVDEYNNPNLNPLKSASTTVGKVLKRGDIVVYESTVYPGATEEVCVPILEKVSGLKINDDFYIGYSPERINPGDRLHTVTKIMKITSGSNQAASEWVDQVYKSVITAGTFRASSIRVAEAAKVIENSQRDINIAFINELSMIFSKIGIDTNEVLEAAATKWNFLNFKPGLVGGHCIGVDPYYLAQKAQEVGYHPEVILAGRRVNDGMGSFIVTETIKRMLRKNISVNSAKALILGITFKENCPDVRNTKVVDIYRALNEYGVQVDVYDPIASIEEVYNEYGIEMLNGRFELTDYQCIIIAVAHNDFKSLEIQTNDSQVIFDVKGFLPSNRVDARL